MQAGSNSQVSWGYWTNTNTTPTSASAVSDLYVAGNITPPSYLDGVINGSATSYTYTHANGGVIGSISNGALMTDGALSMKFNFGGGSSSIDSTSWISFKENGGTLWKATGFSGAVSRDGFGISSVTKHADSGVNITSGSGGGYFFGNSAETIGGKFTFSGDGKTANGGFVGTR